MKLKHIFITLLLSALCLVTGWWRAEFARAEMTPEIDQWRLLSNAEIDTKRYAEVVKTMHGTDIFPLSREETLRLEELKLSGALEEQAGRPVFPTIVGASVLNGVPHVHLRIEDNTFTKAKTGDVLESGWELLSVDLNQINAGFDGETYEFWVTNYDVKPEETTN